MCTWKIFVISFVATAIGIPIIIFSLGKLSGLATYTARNSNDTGYFTRYYQVKYRSVEEIYEYMHDLVTNYTFFCKLHTIGHTGHKGELAGYPIHMVSMSSGFTKPKILVIGGIYANDWTSVTSALFMINQLLTNCEATGTLVTSYNWMFIPILNPDGYNYSKSIPVGNHWIKNIARWSMDATGVNLNYNFGTNWKSNFNFHEDTYPGIHSFSEKESQILRDFVLNTKNHIEMVVILRSATKRFQINRPCITFPWSHAIQKVHNWYILQFLAALASRTTNKKWSSSYEVMQSENCEKNQSGTIDDWLYSAGRIKKVFTIQRDFKASEVYSPYKVITKVGEEVFSIIEKIAMNALMHPNDIKEHQPEMTIDGKIYNKKLTTFPKVRKIKIK